MFDKIKWWIYKKCLNWYIGSRYKFIQLSEYRKIYVSYSWDNDKLFLTLYNPIYSSKENIVELSLDCHGKVDYLKNSGTCLYSQSSKESANK